LSPVKTRSVNISPDLVKYDEIKPAQGQNKGKTNKILDQVFDQIFKKDDNKTQP
jgi:hypothetical protein